MTKHEHFRSPEVTAKLSGFALRALTVVTSELKSAVNDNDRICHPVEENVLQALLKAACHPDRASFDSAISGLLAQGVTSEEIANVHVPCIARTLGEDWVQDRRNFVSVTVGCARLQGYLRHKGLNWADELSVGRNSLASVLLVVPEFEQHTLGATLLAGQLRARGVEVCLQLQVPTIQIERLASQRSYDAVLISSSQDQTLDALRSFVSNTRNGIDDAPVLIGGNVLDQSSEVLRHTGADFTANSWQSALDLITPRAQKRKAGATALRVGA